MRADDLVAGCPRPAVRSLAGAHRGRRRWCDFAPLLADRTLTVSPGPGTVQLDGLAPSGPRLTRVDALLERRVALSEVGERVVFSDVVALQV